MKPVIRVDIVSDVVCPWCYIGKRRVEKAMEKLKDDFTFEVSYHPFELNPAIPPQGFDQKKYLSEKFGSGRYDQITGQVTSVAATEGLNFNFDKQKISPNTRVMHRLIMLAGEKHVQIPVTEAFFKAYFTDGVDLSDANNLSAIAIAAGLDEQDVKNLLESDQNLAEVISAEHKMKELGISGVPFYIINNKYGVSGAQASETFMQAFSEAGKESLAEISSGEACDADAKDC